MHLKESLKHLRNLGASAQTPPWKGNGVGGGAFRQPQGLFRRQRNESLPGSDNLVGNAIKAGDGSRFRHDWTGPTYPIVR